MITQKEYELLKNYHDKGHKWMARDKNKMLYMHKYKPFKRNRVWGTSGDETSYSYVVNSYRSDIFKAITWEDEEPTKINDLISDYESHQKINKEEIT